MSTTKRFRVALSFPGERRARVEKIAEALADKLGRILVSGHGLSRAAKFEELKGFSPWSSSSERLA